MTLVVGNITTDRIFILVLSPRYSLPNAGMATLSNLTSFNTSAIKYPVQDALIGMTALSVDDPNNYELVILNREMIMIIQMKVYTVQTHR